MQPQELNAIRDEVLLLDVREPFEFDSGHIEGAVLVPLQDLPTNLDRLDKTKTVVAICHVGQRSELAAHFLRDQGFDAHNLEGGMRLWDAQGLPSTSGS